MPTISFRARNYWFSYRNWKLEADKGGGSGSEPRPVDESGLEFLPGGEMLRGATTTGAPAEDNEGLPAQWTQENATGEEDEDLETREPEKQEAAAGTVEAGKEKTEVPASAPDMKDWPEAARTHVEAVQKERDALKTEKETLAAEVQKLKDGAPQAAPAVTGAGPLARVTSEGLAAHAALAKSLRSWALRHVASGGELPKELQARVEGRKVEDITEPRTLTAEEVGSILENTEAMLSDHIPARREWLATEKETNDWLAKEYPAYVDAKTPEGQLMEEFARQFPQVKQLPRWRTVLASVVRGHLAFEADHAAKVKKAAGNSEVPIAPVPPSGGRGGSTGAAKPPISKPKGKSAELSASMDADDLARVL